jgi:hypothetical protein
MRRLGAVVLAAVLAGCAAEPGRAGDPDPAAGTAVSTSSTTAPAGPVLPLPGHRPVAAGDPSGLTTQLATALDVLAWPGRPIEEVVSAGHLQQVALAALAARPEWDAAVAERLPPAHRLAVATDVGAVRELQALVRRPRPTLPAWRVRRPPPADDLRAWYAEAEAATGVPWSLLAAVHLVETRMSRIDGTSTAGAQGPMQFLPSTWAVYGEGGDIRDNRDAILGAARFLAASGARDDPYRALLRYNPTPPYARAVAAFAGRMAADERAFAGYHGWEVHYRTTLGDVWLRPGYAATEERPVTADDLR